MKNLTAIVAAAALQLLPGAVHGQAQDHEHAEMSASAGVPEAATVATPAAAPAGQAAFEAINDVVRRLEADPSTDWSTVDIEALRLHLIDMDRVFTEAGVETTTIPGGARFLVRGTGDAVGSIQRMAGAHARALENSEQFRAAVETTSDGVTMDVTAADGLPETVAKIRGLGFAGLLTLDDHHAPHHWMMATGSAPPGH